MSKENPKFLICDDSVLARRKLVDTLNSLGYDNVITVANGQEAVDTYKSDKPDIVILDIVMPVKDGITATKEIISPIQRATSTIVKSSTSPSDRYPFASLAILRSTSAEKMPLTRSFI